MKPLSTFYLKLLAWLLLFGACTLLYEYLTREDFKIAIFLWSFLFMSFLFFLSARFHISVLRDLGVTEFTESELGSSHSIILNSRLPLDKVRDVLVNNYIFSKIRLNEESAILTAQKHEYFLLRLDIVKIECIGSSDKTYRYKLTSAPWWKYTVLDHGRNLRTIKLIQNQIESRSPILNTSMTETNSVLSFS